MQDHLNITEDHPIMLQYCCGQSSILLLLPFPFISWACALSIFCRPAITFNALTMQVYSGTPYFACCSSNRITWVPEGISSYCNSLLLYGYKYHMMAESAQPLYPILLRGHRLWPHYYLCKRGWHKGAQGELAIGQRDGLGNLWRLFGNERWRLFRWSVTLRRLDQVAHILRCED